MSDDQADDQADETEDRIYESGNWPDLAYGYTAAAGPRWKAPAADYPPRANWPDPADGDEVAAGPHWVAPVPDYPSRAGEVSRWFEPVPGPAPAEPVTPTTVPPAYRVWAPGVVEAG